MDPDQTAPRGVVRSGSILFVYEASRQKHTFCDYALKGLINVSSVCIRLGFSRNTCTFAWPKQLINSSPNYK